MQRLQALGRIAVKGERKEKMKAVKRKLSSFNSRLGMSFWVLVVIASLILFWRFVSNDNTPNTVVVESAPAVKPTPPSNEEVEATRRKRQDELKLMLEKEKLRTDVELRFAKYKSDVGAIYEKYNKMLPLSEAADFLKVAEDGAAFITSKDGLCGWKSCAVLAYKMAYDKVKKTKRGEEAILPIVTSRIVNPITNAVNVYTRWTADFRHEIEKEDKAFSLDLALRSHQFNSEISVLTTVATTNMSGAVDKFVDEIKNNVTEKVFAGTGVALELALIKSSYSVIKKIVLKIATVALTGVSTKMAGTAVSATASAAVDGPLPIGDVVGSAIAIGGLAWTAYDIYKVTEKMPAEMKANILKAIDETKAQLVKTGHENLNRHRDACLKSAEARVSQLFDLVK